MLPVARNFEIVLTGSRTCRNDIQYVEDDYTVCVTDKIHVHVHVHTYIHTYTEVH